MPVELPNLDDLTFNDLIAEALRLIPTYAPLWTNHNPSDPGITLLELLAYLTEMQLYRINCVPESHIRMFLKLLNGSESEAYANEDLNTAIMNTIQDIRKVDRAVSCDDYVRLAMEADKRVARVLCLAKRDLRRSFDREAPGYVGLIVVPKKEYPDCLNPIIDTVKDHLEGRRLITTRIHVLGPQYLDFQISYKLILLPGFLEMGVYKSCNAKLSDYFSPDVWPFGRNVYVSEIYALLDRVAGVDAVEDVSIGIVPSTNLYSSKITSTSIVLKPHVLIRLLLINQEPQLPIVFVHENFKGEHKALDIGRYDFVQINSWLGNDTISSAKVPPGWRLSLFQHAEYKGEKRILTFDTMALPGFDNKTSSIIVERI